MSWFTTVPLGNQKKVPLGNFPQEAFPRGNVVFKRTMFIGMLRGAKIEQIAYF